MKSPSDWSCRLAKQWHQAELRVSRLLQPGSWPLKLKIGRPSAEVFTQNPERVRRHVQAWRQVTIGQVDFQPESYRAGSEPVPMPHTWRLATPSEWLQATQDAVIQAEFQRLAQLVKVVPDPQFRALMVRQRRLVLDRPPAEVIRCAEVAMLLEQGCASGRPLRALTIGNIDSKFFERNRALVTQFLDLRFDGLVSSMGLEQFLGAEEFTDHWLLLVPLAAGLLPFDQQRVPVQSLVSMPAAVSHIIIVENERCTHQLPPLPGTVAILGAGLNLEWMTGGWLGTRRIAYWGDMDTWGLAMLATARLHQPRLESVLMSVECFEQHQATLAVIEPSIAGATPPSELSDCEKSLYEHLLNIARGRLEQEFLPAELVSSALRAWHGNM
ncbi:Wadjet anti-phage system protein JetD domain-containing protein [Pseudomonas sp. TCU-HL1]|uniref:Wadjet anti-phage system protein JetD domain-containing protein n=1 Tax=Pseudomonas sp. TCU-HL1 TaxID=1856685 RepID=UPI00083D3BE3|nr:Wadjet anti-phage system protein JetD domain-containing protein [Pseudomonas sp. TCU-HL1]AOE85878.1 hypothetical protein THL1_3330 [Pseudomonas sp. TCU-HL1]